MCNVPCSICGDFDGCQIRENKPFYFSVYLKDLYIGQLQTSKKLAEEFTMFNPDITLKLVIENEDNEITLL